LLVLGNTYVLAKVEVHSWHTEVWLEGILGVFNSVSFHLEESEMIAWNIMQRKEVTK
jgi:hypothetical protein